MYEFILREWGARAPLDMMDHYARGQREEAAFQSVLGVSREQFLERFKAWAKQQVVAWGMTLKEGEPDIERLLLEDATSSPDKVQEITQHLEEGARQGALALVGAGGGGADDWSLELGPPTKEMVAAWLEKHPDNPDVLELSVQLALAESGKKATPEIAPLLERYGAARPVDPLPHQLLATLYLREGGPDAQKAIEHLEYLDAREQRTPAYCLELARRYGAAGDWEKAGVKAERATQLSPYDAGARELAASVAIKRNDFKAAERHLIALTVLEPDVPKHKQRLEALKKLAGEHAGAAGP